MVRDLYRQYAPQARGARGAAFFSLLLMAVAVLGHRFEAIPTPEFLWVLAIVAALALIALVLAILALRRVWIEDDAGAGSALVGLFLALIVLGPFALAAFGTLALPRLTDISTDRVTPPALTVAAEARDARMNPITGISPAAADAMAAAYPDLAGRSYTLPLAEVAQAVLEIAEARGFEMLSAGPPDASGAITLEFIGRSILFGFPSDVAIRLRGNGNSTQVDMRSTSRYGGHDLGENARRIGSFLAALDHRVDVLAGLVIEDEE